MNFNFLISIRLNRFILSCGESPKCVQFLLRKIYAAQDYPIILL